MKSIEIIIKIGLFKSMKINIIIIIKDIIMKIINMENMRIIITEEEEKKIIEEIIVIIIKSIIIIIVSK